MMPEPATRGLTPKGRQTRDRIVDAAADLFHDRGVDEVSLDDVRSVTGTSKSQLYHYFADKSALVHSVIERQEERILDFHRPALAALSSWEQLEQWRRIIIETQAARQCRGGCPLGSLVVELVDVDENARTRLANAFAYWEKVLENGFEDMKAAGLLRASAKADELALSVMASLQGGLLLVQLERNTRPLEIALDSALAHVRSFAPAPHA